MAKAKRRKSQKKKEAVFRPVFRWCRRTNERSGQTEFNRGIILGNYFGAYTGLLDQNIVYTSNKGMSMKVAEDVAETIKSKFEDVTRIVAEAAASGFGKSVR